MPMTGLSMTGRSEQMLTSQRLEFLRFLLVAISGLVVDLTLAWLLVERADQPLWLAAVAGFAAGTCVNYVLHELWTFREGHRHLSVLRAGKYGLALGLTLLVRLAVILLLQSLFGSGAPTLLVLGLATGVSFLVNYSASKWLVFRKATPEQESNK